MMRVRRILALAAVGAAMLSASAAMAQPAGHITGLAGVYVKSKDPKAVAAWYRDVLGLDVKSWGGAILHADAPGHPPYALWSSFPETSEEMAGSTREYSINFAVDDLDAFVARLTAKGVAILKREEDKTGKFAWILDPEGAKIEFWQPK
jgi:predicted enzyme related to lactoylglutathione lyase